MNLKLEKYFKIIEDDIVSFLDKVKNKEKFTFAPVSNGITKVGSDLKLGFSCYGLKINHMLNNPLNESFEHWGDYINSYQNEVGEFIDNSYVYHMKKYNYESSLKEITKSVLNLFGNSYTTKKTLLKDTIRAETKQSISSLRELGLSNRILYSAFPYDLNKFEKYLNSLNWSKPWASGAQFAALSVFITTQLQDKNIQDNLKHYLIQFANLISDKSTGTYFIGNIKNREEMINGAMKIITGLDWLDGEIIYPNELIDFCLKKKPLHEGCHVVDSVYVLWKCSQQTNYRKKEIINYLLEIIEIIDLHKFEQSGFSYYLNKSQIYYYGMKITKGYNTPDLHGTLLFLWSLTMINDICEIGLDWKTLKP